MDRRLPRLWAFCLIWPVALGCQSLHDAGLLGSFDRAGDSREEETHRRQFLERA